MSGGGEGGSLCCGEGLEESGKCVGEGGQAPEGRLGSDAGLLEGKCVPELDETDGLQLVEGLVTTVERTELQAVAQPLTAVRRDRPISLIQLEPRSPAPPANDALVEEAEGVLETEFPGREVE